jgi:peptidoglycan hydrolase CwlO-like protein
VPCFIELAQGVQSAQSTADSSEANASEQRLTGLTEQKENIGSNISQMNEQKEQVSGSTKEFETKITELVTDIEQLGVNGLSDVPRIK